MIAQGFITGHEAHLLARWSDLDVNRDFVFVLNDPDTREAWGVSDEQYEQLVDAERQSRRVQELRRNPEYRALDDATEEIMRQHVAPQDVLMQNVDAKVLENLLTLWGKRASLSESIVSDALDKVMTQELKQKRDEMRLAKMSMFLFVSPGMFEVLTLTDTQRQQMRGIKKESEPEFKGLVEIYINLRRINANKIIDEIDRQGLSEEPEDRWSIQNKLMLEDPEFKKNYEKAGSLWKPFSTRFKIKLFDVLTDEQWTRMQDLVDNPPEHVKATRFRREREMPQRTALDPSLSILRPSGEAIPEEYRQARNAR